MLQEDGYWASGTGRNVRSELSIHLSGDWWYSGYVRRTVISLSVRISFSLGSSCFSVPFKDRDNSACEKEKKKVRREGLHLHANNCFEMQRLEGVVGGLSAQSPGGQMGK